MPRPPFWQWLRTAPSGVKFRDFQFFAAALYGILYFLYGNRGPVFLWYAWTEILGKPDPLRGLTSTSTPYLIAGMLACGTLCGLAAAGAVWLLLSRAMQARSRSPVRFAIWGALGAGSPMLSMVPTAEGILMLFVLLILGAGAGVASYWIIQRDQDLTKRLPPAIATQGADEEEKYRLLDSSARDA